MVARRRKGGRADIKPVPQPLQGISRTQRHRRQPSPRIFLTSTSLQDQRDHNSSINQSITHSINQSINQSQSSEGGQKKKKKKKKKRTFRTIMLPLPIIAYRTLPSGLVEAYRPNARSLMMYIFPRQSAFLAHRSVEDPQPCCRRSRYPSRLQRRSKNPESRSKGKKRKGLAYSECLPVSWLSVSCERSFLYNYIYLQY